MRFKVDENLHPDVAEFLRQHGHEALTVHDQGLRGHADADIARVCRDESRALVTVDLDFTDIRVYPPQDYAGIVVLRLNDLSRPSTLRVLARVVSLFDTEPLIGRLWIVDESRIRIRGSGASGNL
jgi:predicted nuclease of predicted toxin-antitoxin system